MFIFRIILVVLPVFAAATAVPRTGGNQNNGGSNKKNANTGGNNSCTEGTTQFCCNNVQSANALSADNKWLLGMLGVNTDNLIGQVGFSCNSVVAGCNAQSVCCQNSQGSGIAVNNCSPATVNV